MIPNGRFCFWESKNFQYVCILWIPMLVFEAFLCGCAVVKGIKMRKSFGPFSFYESGQRLIVVLFRDSIIYFFAYVSFQIYRHMRLTILYRWIILTSIGASYLTSILMTSKFVPVSNTQLYPLDGGSHDTQRSLGEVPLGFAIGFPCIMANRLVLNIRGTARSQEEITHVYCNTLGGHSLRAGERPQESIHFAVQSYLSL